MHRNLKTLQTLHFMPQCMNVYEYFSSTLVKLLIHLDFSNILKYNTNMTKWYKKCFKNRAHSVPLL